MNSCFHGSAVTQRQYYLNPVMQVSDAENGKRPQLHIEGRSLNQINENERKWCLTERDRFDTPYTMKKMKRNPKTIFRPQVLTITNEGDTISVPVQPTTKKKKQRPKK